ncbi:oligogalacturonate lyase family protein [Cohnella hongkongensis]|uniref:Oligogalacturonate lyase family protein n=1 Tax=Cohnella hongkongensis TaxID=178337 RepID=A0ABV9FNJ2_9BACL
MNPTLVTELNDSNDQLLYFTTSSLTQDDRHLIFISDRTGHPNIFCKELATGEERQLTDNSEGTLKSYVYFNGNFGKGLGKAGICLDSKHGRIYYIQGMEICCVDLSGKKRVLNRLPEHQVTAFTHVSADGKRLCVPTTDSRALEADEFVDDSPGYALEQDGKNEVISNKPNYDIDERVRTENLNSYLRVYDTDTGREIACEKVPRAWITHVQFSPADSNLILYNHEWPSDCGIRRLWLWDGQKHIRLRSENDERSRNDWASHEMWQADGQSIIYHGKYRNGTAFVGKVDPRGEENVEIKLPVQYRRYGHFTAGRLHNNWLVSDGYYHPVGVPENKNWGGEWITLQIIDWEEKRIEWIPLCEHHSFWDSQDSHPHPIFNPSDRAVYFTSNRDGKRAVYRIEIPDAVK